MKTKIIIPASIPSKYGEKHTNLRSTKQFVTNSYFHGLIIGVVFSLIGVIGFSQDIGINTTGATPNISAILDVDGTIGGILIPRMTTAQRNAIASPARSLLIFNTDCNIFQFWDSLKWVALTSKNSLVPPSFSNSVTFSYTGSVQSWTVPANVCFIRIKTWGAGGGAGGSDGAGPGGWGGGGGYVDTILNVSEGDVLSIYVGRYGGGGGNYCGNCAGGTGGWGNGNGGNGGNAGPSGQSGGGGGGGGGSAIVTWNTLLVAAGGAGGGGAGNNTCNGGAGGSTGQNGGAGCGTGGATGASANTNGTAGQNKSGDGGGAGGGGGGVNGGTGGSTSGADSGAGGGGGGKNYCFSCTTIINGSGTTPGNSGDSDLCGGCAQGAAATSANGGNGFVKIYY